MGGGGHVANVGERSAYRVFVGKLEGKKHIGVEEKIILKWTFKKNFGITWTRLIWLRQGQTVGSCECGN